jgi:hypothetical protein
MPTVLLNRRYMLSSEQRQRLEHAASVLPAAQRVLFHERVRQMLWRMPSRGQVTDAMVGVAISCVQHEQTEAASMKQIAQRLLFGRFLNFITVVINADSVPANLTNNNRAAR